MAEVQNDSFFKGTCVEMRATVDLFTKRGEKLNEPRPKQESRGCTALRRRRRRREELKSHLVTWQVLCDAPGTGVSHRRQRMVRLPGSEGLLGPVSAALGSLVRGRMQTY